MFNLSLKSDDEMFHVALYDWLISRNLTEKLLEVRITCLRCLISVFDFDYISLWTKFIFLTQESPPAWTQEAYRPSCSEYSFCCSILVDPPLPSPTNPPPPRSGPQLADPPTFPAGWTPPSPFSAGWPPPPPPQVWTDKQKWNYYLPVVLRTRAVKTSWKCVSLKIHFTHQYYNNFQIQSPYLEPYLKRQASLQPDHIAMLDLLWRHYEKSKKFSAAARILAKLADRHRYV